jgi:hypothetical protein
MQMLGSTGFGDMQAVVRMPSFTEAEDDMDDGQWSGGRGYGGEDSGKGNADRRRSPDGGPSEQSFPRMSEARDLSYDVRAWLHAQLLELTNDGTLLYGEPVSSLIVPLV